MSQRLLHQRRIDEVVYVRRLSENARLERGDQGFRVLVSEHLCSQPLWRRFWIAHEVAHTLLYDLHGWPPERQLVFRPGDPDLEWFCSYLAKSLLMPEGLLADELAVRPDPGASAFRLTDLQMLSRRFAVPWRILGERLVEDCCLWTCALLLLQGYSFPGRSEWRLEWQALPAACRDRWFVPIGRRQATGQMAFPRARRKASEFLTSLSRSDTSVDVGAARVCSDVFRFGGGEFHEMLRCLAGESVTVHWAIRRRGPAPALPLSGGRHGRGSTIFLLIGLPSGAAEILGGEEARHSVRVPQGE